MKNITSNIIIGILLLLVALGVLWLLTRTPDLMNQLNTSKPPPVPVKTAPLSPTTGTPLVPKPKEVVTEPPASKPSLQ